MVINLRRILKKKLKNYLKLNKNNFFLGKFTLRKKFLSKKTLISLYFRMIYV